MENNNQENNELESLEGPGTVIESGGSSTPSNEVHTDTASDPDTDNAPKPAKRLGLFTRVQKLVSHFNVYLLVFVLIFVLASGAAFVLYQRNRNDGADTSIANSPLSPEALRELQGNETKVGDPKQTLSIESNTIFTGRVLLRDSLDVAGTIRVGGSVNLPGITVSGTSSFDQIQANSLSISGDTNIQGQLTIEQSLSVTGGASFGGGISAPVLNVQSLQLSGDLQINRHIDAGGATPGRSNGGALGAGGTSSLSGTDTAGTITLNIGGGPPAGCFITVQFTNSFNNTPHVVVTPVGSAGAGLNYYVNRSASGFSLCSTNAAPSGTSFSFDYIVID